MVEVYTRARGEVVGITLASLSGAVKSIRFSTGREVTTMVRNPKRWYWIVVAVMVCVTIAACAQTSKARSFVEQGKTKAELGQYQEAIADFDEAIRLQPDYVNAYVNRGI